jgi:hypothetical protein
MTILGKFLKSLVPREGLYCVWFRAREGKNAPLIRVWIDPTMTIFESGAKVHEPDLEAARSEILAGSEDGIS